MVNISESYFLSNLFILSRSALYAFLCWPYVSGVLVTRPRSTEVLVGQRTRLNCSTSVVDDVNQIEWFYYAVGSAIYKYIFRKGNLTDDIYLESPRTLEFYADPSGGIVDLIFLSVEERHAGKYKCSDQGINESLSSSSADFIVLSQAPTCESNMSTDGIVGSNSCGMEEEDVQLSCRVPYRGNNRPILKWNMMIGDNATDIETGNYTQKNTSDTVVYNLMMKADLNLDGSYFVCQTTRSSTVNYNCRSKQIKLLYVISMPTVNISRSFNFGESVKCPVNFSVGLECRFKWSDDNGGEVESESEMLSVQKVGSHKCRAECKIRNNTCIVDSIVHVEKLLHNESTNKNLLWMLLFLLIPVGGIALHIFRKHRQQRLRTRKTGGNNVKTAVPLIAGTPGVEIIAVDIIPDERESVVPNRLLAPDTAKEDEDEDDGPYNGADLPNMVGYNVNRESIQIIETMASRKGKAIRGITILNEKLFITTADSHVVEVYRNCYENNVLLKMERSRSFECDELDEPADIASCEKNQCLYIINEIDREPGKTREKIAILKFDTDGNKIGGWSTDGDYGRRLSVTDIKTIILAVYDKHKLNEYSPDGRLTREILLSTAEIFYPMHAVRVTDGLDVVYYLVSHGHNDRWEKKLKHRVCKISLPKLDERHPVDEGVERVHGSFIKSFGGDRGSTSKEEIQDPALLDTPRYLALDREGNIAVADYGKKRVLLLNSDLERKGEILTTKKHGLHHPVRLVFDQTNRRLFVADNRKNWAKGQVLICKFEN